MSNNYFDTPLTPFEEIELEDKGEKLYYRIYQFTATEGAFILASLSESEGKPLTEIQKEPLLSKSMRFVCRKITDEKYLSLSSIDLINKYCPTPKILVELQNKLIDLNGKLFL